MRFFHAGAAALFSYVFVFAPSVWAEDASSKSKSTKRDDSESSYIIAKGSLSPNGRYAVAFAKAGEDDPDKARNFLVAVKPFRIITELDGDGMIPGSKRLSLEVKWTPDSSEVIATTKHDKWDMIVGSSFVLLRDGNPARRVNLLDAINRKLQADFRKSKAEVYNDLLPFILTESSIGFEAGGKAIHVKTNAGNDPNDARKIQWTAEFDGVWSVADEKWEVRKLTSSAKKNPLLEQ